MLLLMAASLLGTTSSVIKVSSNLSYKSAFDCGPIRYGVSLPARLSREGAEALGAMGLLEAFPG